MKKITILLFLSTIFLMGCGDSENRTINSKTSTVDQQEKARLDSLEPIKPDSLSKIKAVNDSIVLAQKFEKEKEIYYQTTKLRKRVIGKNIFDVRINDNYGNPETLSGTDNNMWITYYSDVDITLVSDKKTEKIINACVGKYSILKYDKTLEIAKKIGKKMKFYDYEEIVSSIKYGSAQKLGMTNCINKDCVEYYSKGNFTTVAFMEFNDNGDFVTLKKIAIGKVPRLNEY